MIMHENTNLQASVSNGPRLQGKALEYSVWRIYIKA